MLRLYANFLLLGILATLLLLGSQQATAVPITFTVQGTVTDVALPPSSGFSVGQTYSASYTFESETVGIPVFGGGKDYPALTSASFSVGSYTASLASTVGSFIEVRDNFFGHTDEYRVILDDINGDPISTSLGPVGPSLLILIDLLDSPFPAALSSDALPLTPPVLSSFPFQGWALDFESPGIFFGRVNGNISSFALAAQVPEPGTLALIGVGLGGLLFIRRRLTLRGGKALAL